VNEHTGAGGNWAKVLYKKAGTSSSEPPFCVVAFVVLPIAQFISCWPWHAAIRIAAAAAADFAVRHPFTRKTMNSICLNSPEKRG
jgi:hypothetical protein